MEFVPLNHVPDFVFGLSEVKLSAARKALVLSETVAVIAVKRPAGQVVAVFGFQAPTLLSDDRTVWFAMLPEAQPTIAELRSCLTTGREYLAGCTGTVTANVFTDSRVACRFAEWLGFEKQGEAEGFTIYWRTN